MKRSIGLVGGAAALGLLSFVLFTREDGFARARPEPDPELAALRSEVQALKKSSRPVTHVYHVNSAEPSGAPAPAQPLPVEPPEPALDPEQAAELERLTMERHRQVADSLAVRLAGERIDAEWSKKTVDQIRDVIATRATGSRLQDAECASSLCRVVLTHDTAELQTGISGVVSNIEPFAEGVLYDYDFESQPPATTLYLIRPGHTFQEDTQPQ